MIDSLLHFTPLREVKLNISTRSWFVIHNVARIECWFVGSYDSTSHGTSTVLWLHSCSFLLYLPLFFAVFPLFPLFFCLFPLFFIYFLCFFAWFLYFSSIFSVYISQHYQQPTDPTYEPCYVPRSIIDTNYIGYTCLCNINHW